MCLVVVGIFGHPCVCVCFQLIDNFLHFILFFWFLNPSLLTHPEWKTNLTVNIYVEPPAPCQEYVTANHPKHQLQAHTHTQSSNKLISVHDTEVCHQLSKALHVCGRRILLRASVCMKCLDVYEYRFDFCSVTPCPSLLLPQDFVYMSATVPASISNCPHVRLCIFESNF